MRLLFILVIAKAVVCENTFQDLDLVDVNEKEIEILGEEIDIDDLVDVLGYFEKDLCAVSADYFFDLFILDLESFESLQKLSPECRQIPCDFTKYLMEYTVKNIESLSDSQDINDFLQRLHDILQPMYSKYFCPCGVELFGWLVDSAKYYDANVLYASLDTTTILFVKRFLRYADSVSLKRFLSKTTQYLCADSQHGVCLDDIMESFKYAAKNIDNTISYYDEFEDLPYGKKEKLKEQCDNYLEVIDLSNQLDYTESMEEGFEFYANVLNKAYCKRNCRNQISKIYPCCLKTALEDKRLYKLGESFGVSLYNLFQIYGSYSYGLQFDLDSVDYMREVFESTTGLSKEYKNLLYRILHPAKYCQKDSKPKCS